MNSRLMLYAPLAPALAIIALAAAGAAAQGVATVAARASANALRDVQVGESGRLMRVALLCRRDCAVAARAGGVYFLPGVDAAIEIDLDGRSQLADALAFTPVEGGSALAIKAPARVLRAAVNPCLIDEAVASCIDLEFAEAAVATADPVPPTPSLRREGPVVATEPPSLAAEDSLRDEPAEIAVAEAAPATQAPPPLREAPAGEQLIFARYAPPERLGAPRLNPPRSPAPPAGAGEDAAPAREAMLRLPPRGPKAEDRPIIREDAAAALFGPEIDILTEAQRILGKRLGVAECEGAQARLRADAWALDAMVDVGFCLAARGELDDGDGVFIRLLAYTPDNYEALVGRALIAAKAGDRSIARKYFQDALNALPPIEESDRIVDAMAAL